MRQFNVKAVYLYGMLPKNVWVFMHQPKGFEEKAAVEAMKRIIWHASSQTCLEPHDALPDAHLGFHLCLNKAHIVLSLEPPWWVPCWYTCGWLHSCWRYYHSWELLQPVHAELERLLLKCWLHGQHLHWAGFVFTHGFLVSIGLHSLSCILV